MRPYLVRSILVLAATMSLLSACTGITPSMKAPDLQVIGVELQRGDLFSQQLKIRLRATNPNDRAIPVRGVNYQLEVAGEPFAQGESMKGFEIPAMGSSEFDISMTANAAAAVMKVLAGGKRTDAIDYRLVGRVSLAAGLLRSIPFDKKGVFNLN